MKEVILTGSQGFIGSYLAKELLDSGYFVYGIDNFSKYGKLSRPHDNHPNFRLITHDLTQPLSDKHFGSIEHIIACAAMIGGISYFHKYAYDLLSTNERILANTFDLAIKLKQQNLKKITVLSSSMVFESSHIYPTPESEVLNCPPPLSTYGFQKLATEYFCKGAWEQYGLPYTILRPFNCVGVGEEKSIQEEKVMSGNVEMMMSHVIPDLVNKVLLGQNPLRLLGDGTQIRCYTNGKDIARGIRISLEHDAARNNDFNISSNEAVNVLYVAELIWKKLKTERFNYISDIPYKYDVRVRVPSTKKAQELLGFKAEIPIETSIDEVIQYLKK